MTGGDAGDGPFRADLEGPGGGTLRMDRLRGGALEVRVEGGRAGAAGVLAAPDAAALAAWLWPSVQGEWMGTVRERLDAQLATADALYGEQRDAARQLAMRLLDEVQPGLLSQAMVLLANAIGPRSRERLVERINRTADFSEDLMLRRRLEDEAEAFARVVAAAALLDALDPDAPEAPARDA